MVVSLPSDSEHISKLYYCVSLKLNDDDDDDSQAEGHVPVVGPRRSAVVLVQEMSADGRSLSAADAPSPPLSSAQSETNTNVLWIRNCSTYSERANNFARGRGASGQPADADAAASGRRMPLQAASSVRRPPCKVRDC